MALLRSFSNTLEQILVVALQGSWSVGDICTTHASIHTASGLEVLGWLGDSTLLTWSYLRSQLFDVISSVQEQVW